MSKSTTTRMKTLDMAYVAMFAAIIAVCSWISIPATVPFTLQTFGVFLAVGVLGGKRGTMAVLTYLLLGMIGVPVFSGFAGGIGYMLGSTGGYIVGFIFTALTMWLMESLFGKKRWVLTFSMLLGILVCYVFGTVWFMWVYANNTGEIGWWTALLWCVVPYIIPDVLKILLALTFCRKLGVVMKIYGRKNGRIKHKD